MQSTKLVSISVTTAKENPMYFNVFKASLEEQASRLIQRAWRKKA